MEQGRTPEIGKLITELEMLGRTQLEQPDGIATNMSYQFGLPEIFSVQLEDRTQSIQPGHDSPGHHTAIFVNRLGEAHDEAHCSHQLAFSMIYDHLEYKLSGAQIIAPIDFPEASPLNNESEKTAFRRILDVANWAYEHRPATVEHPSLVNHYNFGSEELTSELGELVSPLLVVTNGLLSKGAFYERRYKKVLSNNASVWIESNTSSGPQEHATRHRASAVGFLVKRFIDRFEYSFEQLEDGSFEVQTRIADIEERYQHYRTFEVTYRDKAGKVMGYNITSAEVKEKEAEDRALGLFEPTAEKLEFLLEPLRNAA